MDEDSDFRESIINSLTKAGILPRIRAELRAAIYEKVANDTTPAIIDKNEIVTTGNISDKKELLALYLIKNYLEKRGLQFSAEVFGKESGFDEINKDVLNEQLLELEINNAEKPVILQLIENCLSNKNMK